MKMCVAEPANAASISSPAAPPLEISLGNTQYLPKRPRRGALGTKIKVSANCWDLEVADTLVYRYDIQPVQLIAHTENGDKVLKSGDKALYKLIKHVLNIMGDDVFSDGRRFVYSLTPLNSRFNVNEANSLTLPESEGSGLELKYAIKEVGTMSASPVKQYLSNPSSSTDNLPQDSINMLDNLMRWINRSRFNVIKSCLLEDKEVDHERYDQHPSFKIFRGFSISARPLWKLRINVDITYKAFFPAGNLADILYEIYGDNLYNPRWKNDIEKHINHLQVEARHYKSPESGRPYSKRLAVHGLSEQSADKLMVPEVNITIAQYFQDRHGIKLQYTDLPCVKTKRAKNEFMPMELLYVLPFQNSREDNSRVAAEIVRIAAAKPQTRSQKIEEFIRKAFVHGGLVKRMGLKISSMKAVNFDARLLPQPTAAFRDAANELKRGSWNVAPFVQPASNLVKYAIVDIFPHGNNNYDKWRSGFETKGKELGLLLRMDHKVLKKLPCQLSDTFVQLANEGVKLVVCILNRNNCYGEIKRICELETFMVTQCIKSGTLRKPCTYEGILLKINGKLGGLNWSIHELANKWGDEAVMVVGADVTHPGQCGPQNLRKSVAAVVASMSPDYMKYVTIVRQQDYRVKSVTDTAREYINEMEDIFKQLLETFGRLNSRLPTKILFYRDGVSESQFKHVAVMELGAMQRACLAVRPDYEPGFTIIVVQKRHHIRLFPENGSGNVQPGTVVDSEITHHREFDFYLCSQQGIQGTSKPAHYHVIYDDNNLDSDELQLFTYYLCHAYMRCARSVSYPAPTYYSHLAASRARDWLKSVRDPESILINNQFKLLPQQQELLFFL